MNGEELYKIYQAKLLEAANCCSDSWEQLEPGDREAWDQTAHAVSERLRDWQGI